VRAKKIMCVGTGVACTVIAILACIIFFFSRQLGMIFSDDPEVLNRFYEIRLPFAATAALMNLTVFLEVVPSTMLYTRTTFIIGLVGSWVGQVPAVLICTQFWRKDLVGLYTGCAIGYGLTSAILAIFFCTVSFKKAADAAVARAAE
jgi:Na+-driven multidrug efflux pump